MSRANRPFGQAFGRLNLEHLESREVPAVNTWVGDNSNFNEADNWTDGIPTPDDILVFGLMEAVGEDEPELPGEGGGTPGPGGGGGPPPPVIIGSHHNVTFPSTADLSYAGIRIINGYTGTVTFPANVSFAEYTQNSGNTSQYADTVVSISNTFGWVGGSINTSASVATYKLLGATGQIGEDATNLSSGSKFVLGSTTNGIGSFVRQSGVLNVLNGLGIDVLEGSTFGQEQLINQQGNKPAVNSDDQVLTKGLTYSKGGKLTSVKVEGGVLKVEEGGLEVTGKVPGQDWSVMVKTDSGRLLIQNGETLKAAHGVYIDGDPFSALCTMRDFDDGATTATIDGKLRFVGGKIQLGEGAPPDVNNLFNLVVTGDAQLWGGEFEPRINPLTSAICEFIKTEKKLDILSAFAISPKYQGEFEPYAGGKWNVLRSQDGFKDDINPTNGDPLDWIMGRSEYVENEAGQMVQLNWWVKWDPL